MAKDVANMNKSVSDLLIEKAELFETKGKEYGHTYKEYGNVMMAFFPEDIPVQPSKEFWNKFGIFNMLVHKMMRLAKTNFGSVDSVKDIQVYAAMLEEILGEDNSNRL